MLSYQHVYHAGNHADILKHFVLSYVVEYLNKKPAPYTFFDTHSGSGLYDLTDSRSLKTGEAEKGILTLFDSLNSDGANSFFYNSDSIPQCLNSYFNLVKKYTGKNFYPGSPEIERQLLRKSDFLVLSELHPQEIENLRTNLQKKPLFPKQDCCQIQIHNRSGWEMIQALTPPKTKRGAVLIDPSYEELSDYENARKTIASVLKKWNNGIVMLWYPLLNYRSSQIETMIEGILCDAKNLNPNIETADIRLEVFEKDSHTETKLESLSEDKKNPPRLYGSGMLVLNAPWLLKETSQEAVDFLTSFFRQKNHEFSGTDA